MTDYSDAINRAAAAAPQDAPTPVPTVVQGRTLLVDGDYLAYYAAGNDECDPGRARQNAIEKIEAFRVLSGCDKVVNHITASESNKGWRFVVATVKPYQGQRNSGRKPKNWRTLRDWMETYRGSQFKSKTWTDREADDGMAYHSQVLGPGLAVIATADKDMRMFSGIHIDWKTYDITHVPPGCFEVIGANGKLYGHKWFWQQLLQGDTADNIPGPEQLRKPNGKFGPVGEKTAEKILLNAKDNADALSRVSAQYRGYYGKAWPDRLAEQAILLWMRTDKQSDIADWLQVAPDNQELIDATLRHAEKVEEELANVQRLSLKDGA